MKKEIFILFISIFITSYSYGQKYSIEGEWYNEEKDAIITVKKERNNTYSGHVTWMKNPNDINGEPKKDVLNPDEKLRGRKRLGLKIMYRFKYNTENEWDGGRIYDPKSGNTYRGTITMNSKNKLDLRGYVGVSWFGRTSYWTRKIK